MQSIASDEPLFAFDDGLRLVAWNRAAERLTGFSSAEVLGRPCWEVLDGVDDAGGAVCVPDCPYARAMRAGETPPGPRVAVRTRAGRRRVEFTLVAVLGEKPRYLHLMRPRDGAAVPGPGLTPRQLEVLTLADHGVSTRRIGEVLGVAETTVRNHLAHAQFKLGCTSRGEAIARARDLGLLEPGAPEVGTTP